MERLRTRLKPSGATWQGILGWGGDCTLKKTGREKFPMPTNEKTDADDFLTEIKRHIEEEERKERPNYLISVYCDKHLGVQMRLADSWSSNEYGNTSVDVNSTLLWYCPKPGCGRHYEPTMFGYHVNEPGRRLQTDGRKPPRGNHLGLPFMYIGKFGEGRRFRCPYYRCDEQGPIVAETVVDEQVELPPDPLTGLKNAEKKRAQELMIFESFASASGLPIDRGSPENRDPDYPDILCTISGQRHWFELAQIIHEEVAEKVNPRRRKIDGGFSYDQEQPFLEVIKSKASKKYVTEGLPVDLILHFDRRFGRSGTVRRLCETHRGLLESLIEIGPFKRVWFFDLFTRAVVWNL